MSKGPVHGMGPEPLTFYWRGRILRVRCDDPMSLYSAPVAIVRRAMGRSSDVTSLQLALRAELGASYLVTVTDEQDGVVVDLKRPRIHTP